MFDRIKQGANLAKFKADQLMREQRVQGEIGGLNSQIAALKDRIAGMVLEMRKNGPLGMPELDDVCAQAEGLAEQIAQKEAQIAAIHAEQAPGAAPQQPAYAPPAAPATKPCPNCNAAVPAQAMFCTSCGYSFQAAPAAPAAPPKPATQICPNCQAEAPATSAFCPNCGKPLAH